jgi:hypothetical protein
VSATAASSRTREAVEREYGEEKWPEIDRLVRSEREAEPDGGLARVLGRVARSQWRNTRPLATQRVVLDGEIARAPLSGAYGAAQVTLLDLVSEACRDETSLIIELGSGWGWHLLTLWAQGGPRGATYVGAEFTAAGRRAAERLAALDPRLQFRSLPFDYHDPFLDGLGSYDHAVVFTVHSIEQIPFVKPTLFDAIRGVASRVTCLHFEPVGWQLDGYGGCGSSAAYAERQDYNRNLVEVLRVEERERRLTIDAIAPDLFGININNSTTVLRWHSDGGQLNSLQPASAT